ncbi:DUF2147 domain-containing protein [Aquimarina pacifica]|uniref:hypothetical protein n=1 Tax=Aquimarina pacifica TaxID=1296415 RepID=UPI0004721E2F|nr:hypothetical protein [Aquimarina pacifica]
MRNKLTILVFALLSIHLFSQSAADDFEGQWKTEQKGVVAISKKTNAFEGMLTGKNVIVLKDLHFENGKWKCVLIRPKDGVEINATATIKDDKITFVAKKYFVTKTITWTKKS